jgi:peptide methionine sulfoxide reductase MsrA
VQKELTLKKIDELSSEGLKIATRVLELGKLYVAEDYHQNYWNLKGK